MNNLVRFLFVCTGNICRSPTAEAVFLARVRERGLEKYLSADSAGITDYHPGEPPDQRSMSAATRRGYDMSQQRARQVRDQDFKDFDYIVALDSQHQRHLIRWQSDLKHDSQNARIVRLMDYLPPQAPPPKQKGDVPDPYYDGPDGFERVLDLIENGCNGLLNQILSDHPLNDENNPIED